MIEVNGRLHNEYFVKYLNVQDSNHMTRYEFLVPFTKDKKVLHVGFVDYPITDVTNNLHIKLSEHCARLDGYDPNYGPESKILDVKNGQNYNDWNNVPDDYDLILVPEVIEHVGNVELFLNQISSKKGTLIVTAPDAFLLYNNFKRSNIFTEVVHPDHNFYFSPYTLNNTINKYSEKKVKSLHWVDYHSICAICGDNA